MKIFIPKTEKVFLLGDTHGNLYSFFDQIANHEYDNSVVIHVGDVGMGFPDGHCAKLDEWNKHLEPYNILMYCIRGNHDDPDYFDGTYTRSHIRLIDDYSVIEYRGQKMQVLGGAISVDRRVRLPGVSYWHGEGIEFDLDKIIECDIFISHSAPQWLGPNDKSGITYWCNNDDTLWAELLIEREQIGRLFDKSKAKKLFCGHFHESSTASDNGRVGRVLDIDELIQLEI